MSHDRYFLDRVTRKTFAFLGQGEIKAYNGSYSDYEARRQEEQAQEKRRAKSAQSSKGVRRNDVASSGDDHLSSKTKSERPRFTYKEQKEFETIEEDIAALEAQLSQTEADMAENATDYSKLAALTEERSRLEIELMEKMERWEYLSELAEKIANYKRR